MLCFMDLTDGTHISAKGSILEKTYLFRMTSDENDFYIKFVVLHGVYNFLVLSFVI